MAKKGAKHETTAMTSDELESIASTLEYFARRYRDVAEQMEKADIEVVHVTGLKTLREKALRFLRGAISSATSALDEAILRLGSTDPVTGKPFSTASQEPGGEPAAKDYLKNKDRRSPKDADDLLKEAHAKSRKAKKSPPSKSSNPDQKSHDAPA